MKLILLDCYGLFYKAHYAFQTNPLSNSKGEDTSVIFFFFNFLHRIISERFPDKLICILDSKGPTHRHKLYQEYKAHRPPMPDSLIQQVEAIKEILPALGLDPIFCTGYEADDIIAHYVYEGRKDPKTKIEIFSADKDLFQLVDEQVTVISSDQKNRNYIFYNAAEIKKKFSLKPQFISDYLALVGDSSDHVPGVKGIGKVTATKLIQSWGSLDHIYQNLDQLKEKERAKLKAGREDALLSKKLVTLKYPLPDDLTVHLPPIETLDWGEIDPKSIVTSWNRFECFSLIKKFNLDSNSSHPTPGTLIKLLAQEPPPQDESEPAALKDFKRQVVDPQGWDKMIEEIQSSKRLVFDLETTSLDPFQAQIVSLVIVVDYQTVKKSYYLPLLFKEEDRLIDREAAFLKTFKTIFENPKIGKIGHHLKFEYTILKAKGIELQGLEHDTMVYEYMIDPDRNQYKLEDLVQNYFQVNKTNYQELSQGEDILSLPAKELEEYTFLDGEYTYLIYQKQQTRLDRTSERLFHSLDMQLIKVLAEMELLGVWIDIPLLKKLRIQITESLKKTKGKIYLLAGEEFNINSTKQLQEILFQKCQLKPIKKTKTGYSTDNYVLTRLAKDHLIAKSLLDYRKNAKLLSTYVEALPKLIHPKTGRIHTHYNQSVVATGRLSSNEPNLQNIPTGKESMGIRQAFIAPPGHLFLSVDYSQVELRILAQLCEDERLLHAYQEGWDIHKMTAHLIFNKEIDQITDSERNIAKTINFSVIYGISSFSLAGDLHISREEARYFIESYFNSYPGVRKYQTTVLEAARKQEYVETHYGRRRYVPGINARNFILKSRSERIAFNTVIQGTASDIIKLAMIEIHRSIEQGKIKAQMVMQVHDELTFYVKEKDIDPTVALIERALCEIKPFEKILKTNFTAQAYWDK